MKLFKKEKIGNRRKITILGFIKFSYKIPTRSKFCQERIDKEIVQNNECLLNDKVRIPRLIVSLTSYPKRIKQVHYGLWTLLKQSLKPDKIVLWLAVEEFPNKEQDLPHELLSLQKAGLEIEWCKNIRSYKKLIPALEKYPNDIIVTADDDAFYYENWLELLYASYEQLPNCIHCHRAHRIKLFEDTIASYKDWEGEIMGGVESHLNFFTGVGGVLYPPNTLHNDIFQKELFDTLTSNGDDIWFWAMSVLNNTKIKVVAKNNYVPFQTIENSQENALWKVNCEQNQNDVMLKNILSHYPHLIKIVLSELL